MKSGISEKCTMIKMSVHYVTQSSVSVSYPFQWTDCIESSLLKFIANQTLSECLFRSTGRPLNGWDLNSFSHSYSMTQSILVRSFTVNVEYYHYNCSMLYCKYDLNTEPIWGPNFRNNSVII